MIPNAYETTLGQSLSQGGSETEIFVESLDLPSGETISISDFEKTGGVGFLLIEGETPRAEYVKFTGIDTTNKKFTGITRGLSFKDNSFTRNNDFVFAHPAGSKVQIVTNTHFLESFVDKNSDETIGGVKTFSNFPVLPNTNPSSLQQAAHKKYVDEVLSGAAGSASETIAGTVKLDKPSLAGSPRVNAVRAHQQATPNMVLSVEPFLLTAPDFNLYFGGGNSPAFIAPSSYPRIDLLVYDSVASNLAIRQGTESASPSIPTPNQDDFVICAVYHRVGETSIKDKDDGVNGYILSSDNQQFLGRAFKKIDGTVKFGGDGSDGALNISSGTTTLDLGGAPVFIKNYSSISITGTGKLAFSNPHPNGTLIVLKSKGNVTITSSANPAIDLRNLGGEGGLGASFSGNGISIYRKSGRGLGWNGSGADASCVTTANFSYSQPAYAGGSGGGNATSGGVGDVNTPYGGSSSYAFGIAGEGGRPQLFSRLTKMIIPGGGGSGGVRVIGITIVDTGVSGRGGRGAGALYIECAGNFNGNSIIDARGENGENGQGGSNNLPASGGGGGAGGSVLILVNGTITNSMTINVAGGIGGSPSPYGGGQGGNGSNGQFLIAKNTEFA